MSVYCLFNLIYLTFNLCLVTFIPVETGGDKSCYGQIPVAPSRGFLASIISQDTNRGTETCPWLLKVPMGQRINITLYDFTPARGRSRVGPNDVAPEVTRHGSFCHMYAQVVEEGSRETVICGGQLRVQPGAYLSMSNKVEVRITKYNNARREARFLFMFEGRSRSLRNDMLYAAEYQVYDH